MYVYVHYRKFPLVTERLLTEMVFLFCSGCSEGGTEEEEEERKEEEYKLTASHVSLPPHVPFEH